MSVCSMRREIEASTQKHRFVMEYKLNDKKVCKHCGYQNIALFKYTGNIGSANGMRLEAGQSLQSQLHWTNK